MSMRTVFVSDTHGFTDELVHLLSRLDVCTPEGEWCADADTQLVHLGDWVDRGPTEDVWRTWTGSLDSWDLVRGWQRAHPEQIVRLAGNHDIQYLDGAESRSYLWCGGTLNWRTGEVERFRAELTEDVTSGAVQFAHAHPHGDEDWLCVHGGLDPRWESFHALPAADAAAELNRHGVEWVRDPTTPRDPITAMDFMRGGYDPIPGVCWCDVEDNLRPVEADITLPQIVGHRIQEVVNLSPLGKTWAINVAYGDAQALIDQDGEWKISDPVRRHDFAHARNNAA